MEAGAFEAPLETETLFGYTSPKKQNNIELINSKGSAVNTMD